MSEENLLEAADEADCLRVKVGEEERLSSGRRLWVQNRGLTWGRLTGRERLTPAGQEQRERGSLRDIREARLSVQRRL